MCQMSNEIFLADLEKRIKALETKLSNSFSEADYYLLKDYKRHYKAILEGRC